MPSPLLRRMPRTLPQAFSRVPPNHPSQAQQEQPPWLSPALLHPQPPSYAKRPARRVTDDLPPTHMLVDGMPFPRYRTSKKRKFRPVPIVYERDIVRKTFFRDFPFEGYRPKSMAEGENVGDMAGAGASDLPPLQPGQEWTELRQRTRHPLPEDAIEFTMELYRAARTRARQEQRPQVSPRLLLQNAYIKATAEYSHLHTLHSISNQYSAMEAESYGTNFWNTEISKNVRLEDRTLQQWNGVTRGRSSAEEAATRKTAISRLLPRDRDVAYRDAQRGQLTDTIGAEYLQQSKPIWIREAEAKYQGRVEAEKSQ